MPAMQELLWALVFLLNIVTVFVFGYDKLQSRRKKPSRVSERFLLWLMFLGGLVGAWVAMSLFRHKTIKRSFRVRAILVTVLNPVWLLVWWWFASRVEA